MLDKHHLRGDFFGILMVISMAWLTAGEPPWTEGLLDENMFKREVAFDKMASKYQRMNDALCDIISEPDPTNNSRSSKALAIAFLRRYKTYEPRREFLIKNLSINIDYHPTPYSFNIPAEQRYPAAMALIELRGSDVIEQVIYNDIALSRGDRTPEQIYLGVFVLYSVLGGKDLVIKALEASKLPELNNGMATLEKAKKGLEWAEAPDAWRKKPKPFVLPEGHPLLNQNPDCRDSVPEEKK